MINRLLLVFLFILPTALNAHSDDFMRSTGKIYSVVAVIAVILIGMFIYLWRLDRKISAMENEFDNQKSQNI